MIFIQFPYDCIAEKNESSLSPSTFLGQFIQVDLEKNKLVMVIYFSKYLSMNFKKKYFWVEQCTTLKLKLRNNKKCLRGFIQKFLYLIMCSHERLTFLTFFYDMSNNISIFSKIRGLQQSGAFVLNLSPFNTT